MGDSGSPFQSQTRYTDTVSVIVQCAFRLLNYNSYSIGIIVETLLDYFELSNGIISQIKTKYYHSAIGGSGHGIRCEENLIMFYDDVLLFSVLSNKSRKMKNISF